MVAFPLAKFVYLGMKQISGPIARQLKVAAKRSQFVSKYICSPPAQTLHRLEMFVKFRLMGAKGKVEYAPLSEEKAAEVGSEMLGEAFIYTIATSYMLYEYYKSVQKGIEKETSTNDSITDIQDKIAKLSLQVGQLRETLDHLQSVKNMPNSNNNNKSKT